MADETKEKAKPTCFIAMPISTPEHLVPDYGNDVEHFRHVLDDLITPAVEEAGFKAISPIASGSEIIHRDIIDNLVQCDLVLVDTSTLNANVFFEFGIRAAMNKPVCLVRDDKTPKVPFDTGIANHHTYASSLHSWVVKVEKPKLIAHVKASFERSKGKNSLWQHFGLKTVGEAPREPDDAKEMLRILLSEVSDLRKGIRDALPDYTGSREIPELDRIIDPRVKAVGCDGETMFLVAVEGLNPADFRDIVTSLPDTFATYHVRFVSMSRFQKMASGAYFASHYY